MPIAIALGGPPALTWAAGISLPKGVSEIDFVGYLAKIDLPMTLCCQSFLAVPAASEIVIEGTIEPGDEMLEGPFGNHSGYYASPSLAPVIRINSIRMKPDAIYPCTVVGPPPMENRFMAKTAERILLKLLQYDYPWVADVHMPTEGIYHRAAIVAIAGQVRLDIEEVREALLSSQLLKNSKCLILVDEGCIDLEAMSQVYWKVVNNMKCLQHAGGVVVDARSAEGAIHVHHDPFVEAVVSERWQEYNLF
jgi:4-hydroxy-3-polyprenylbenzoate decarboxylase